MPSPERAINLPPVVTWLALFMIAVHLGRWLAGPVVDEWLLLAFSFIPARYHGAVDLLPGGEAAWFWSPLTYSFLHADGMHLAVNLLWMASFGSAVAHRFGSGRFLVLWGIAAVAGALAHYVSNPGDGSIVLGASGAVSGITAAAARFAFAERGPLGQFGAGRASYRAPALSLVQTFMQRRAVTFIAIWFAMNLLFGLAGGMILGIEEEIAWQAHLGGFVAGLLGFAALDPVRRGPNDPDGTGPMEDARHQAQAVAGNSVPRISDLP